MGIDLVTLIAQIINLVVLIWLMKRFLYQPILKMVSERQALIDAEIKRAHQARQEALLQEAQYNKKLSDFEAKRSEMLSQVRQEVDAFQQKLLTESKQAIAYSRKNWQAELEQEKQSFDVTLQAAIVKNFKIFASDALQDMAGIELSSLVLKKFKEKMQKISKTSYKQMQDNILKNGKVIVSTDTKLDNQTKADIKAFLTDFFVLQNDVKFEFKEDAELICGIQIQVGEHQTSWNLKNYLEAFEDNMDAAFNELLHQGA